MYRLEDDDALRWEVAAQWPSLTSRQHVVLELIAAEVHDYPCLTPSEAQAGDPFLNLADKVFALECKIYALKAEQHDHELIEKRAGYKSSMDAAKKRLSQLKRRFDAMGYGVDRAGSRVAFHAYYATTHAYGA